MAEHLECSKQTKELKEVKNKQLARTRAFARAYQPLKSYTTYKPID